MMKKDDDKGFITAIANAITKKTIERVNNTKQEVEGFLDKHLESIIMLGLGIKRDSWGKFQFERVNGFAGLIVSYVQNLANVAANEKAEAVLRDIVEVRTKEMLAKGVGEAARGLYVSTYRETLYNLVKDHLNAKEAEFKEMLQPVVAETAMRLDVLTTNQLRELIGSIHKHSNKAAK